VTASPHVLEFYDNDAFLAESLAARLGAAIREGRPSFAVLTASHRAALEAVLESGTHITFLDTHDVARKLTASNAIDREAFREVFGDLLRAGALWVGDLCDHFIRSGRVNDAMVVEALFDAAMKEVAFETVCAYGLDHSRAELERLRAQHRKG
jgi:hypothetical protein